MWGPTQILDRLEKTSRRLKKTTTSSTPPKMKRTFLDSVRGNMLEHQTAPRQVFRQPQKKMDCETPVRPPSGRLYCVARPPAAVDKVWVHMVTRRSHKQFSWYVQSFMWLASHSHALQLLKSFVGTGVLFLGKA